jgi:hypothetical protein
MKKINNKILIGFLVLITSFYKTQVLNIPKSPVLNIPRVPVVKSPQIYDMERFGNIPVSLNTGSVSYDVNLFRYENIYGNNGLSIDLKYYGTGFMPSKQSNYVGLDWILNFGGSISREIRGVADDLNSDWPFSPSDNLYGYLEGVKMCNKYNIDIYNQNYSMLTMGNGGKGIKCGTDYYELEPDKFNFNFMGMNGYFFIGNNLTPIIISDTPNLKIDVSGLESKQYKYPNDSKRCITKSTTITITDGEGIKYYFGGEYDNLEVSYHLSQDDIQRESPFTITSWNLYKIEYPNTKVLEIKYLPSQYQLGDGRFCTDGTGNIGSSIQEPFLLMFDHHHVTRHYFNQTNYNYNTSSGNIFFDGTINWGNGSSMASGASKSFSATKKSIPGTILLDGKEIVKLNFERFDQYLGYTIPSLKLKNITFYNDAGKNVKDIELSYYRHKNYFFLDKIKLFRKEPLSQDFLQEYIFDYYRKNDLPDETIGTTDYWGYWNNKPKPRPIPNFSVDKNTGEFTFINGSWDATPELCSVSLLKSIIYPTKGISEFIYEPHKYSQKLDRNYASQFKNVLVQSNGIVGGGRISRIINYSNDGSQIGAKDYKYISNYTPNGLNTKSSGILSNYYRNYIYVRNQNGYSTTENLEVYSDNLIEATMNSSPVLYSEVTEIENNKGYTKYYFTDLETHPDSEIFKEVDNDIAQGMTFAPANISNINLPYRSNNYKRSKLYKQEVYDQNFIKIKTSTTEFIDIAESIPGNYVTHVTDRLRTKYFFKQFGGLFTPKKIEVEDSFNTSNIKSTTEMFYEGNNHLNLTKEINTFADHSIISTNYSYAKDVDANNALMVSKNMIGIPTIVETTKDNKTVSKVTSIYPTSLPTAQTGNLVLPLKSNSLDIHTNISSDDVVYDKYDEKGNLQQYTTKAGIPTTIIWGYNQNLPIAKIEGAKLQDISQSLINNIVNSSNFDAQIGSDASESDLISALDGFRTHTELSDYQVSTYTYDPSIGIRSITLPSGTRESYLYDAANKLEKIADSNERILKEYKYNYAFRYYNTEKKQTFNRNNCQPGYIGGAYTYTVGNGVYNSSVSQTDADSKAQDEINTYGQIFANTNATCEPKSCYIQGVASAGNIYSPLTSGSVVTYMPGAYKVRVHFYHNGGTTKALIQGDCVLTTSHLQTINTGNWQILTTNTGDLSISIKPFVNVTVPNGFVELEFYVPIN